MFTYCGYLLMSVLFIFASATTALGQDDPGCGDFFFDSGGQTGVYSNNELTETTFCPDNPGDVVTLTFNYVDIESTLGTGIQDGCWDFIEIFDGPDTDSPSLGVFCGEESGDGGVPSNPDALLSIGDAFTATNDEGCLTVVFDSDGSVTETGWEALVSCGPPPNCTAPEYSIVTERDCETLSFSATVTIDAPADPPTAPLLVFAATVDGEQVGGGTVPNLAGQTLELGPFDLDVDVIVEANVLGLACPSAEVLNVSSIGCPIPLTCGEGLEETYCYDNNDEVVFAYQSPDGEPVIIFFQSGLIESGFDEIFIYDGEDNSGTLLFGGDNGGDLTGLSATAESGNMFIELDTDGSVSCQSSTTYEDGWAWIVGCGEFDIPGCTDENALNFSPEATVDDGSCIFPAVNDEPCGAVVLECNADALTGNFDTSSLSDDIVPLAGCGSTFNTPPGDLWFQFESDGNSTYLISAEEGPDMVVALFSGDDCGNLTEVEACSDFPESFSGSYPAGTYYFMVRPWSGSTFNNSYVVSLTCVEGTPDNDEPCGATPLVCNDPAVDGAFLGATASIDDECSGSGTGDIWFSFVSDGATAYSIAEVSFSDVVISLYTASECDGELIEVESCSDFPEDFSGIYEAGNYFVRVRPWSTAQTCSVQLTCATPPENDLACNAIEIDCESGNVLGTTLGATDDDDCGGAAGGAGVWYVFNSDIDGTLRLNTCQDDTPNTTYDSDISVFTGTCDALTCLVYNDGNFTCGFKSDVTFDVLNGQTYYIQVHGWNGEGNFDMEVTCTEVVLDCPGVGNIGEVCDDGDPATVNDVITEDCVCAGTPPPPGQVCGIPIDVDELPYFDTGNNTSGFGDDYDFNDIPPLAPDGILVGTFFSTSYLNGDDVVYAYTPTEDQQIDVRLDNIGTWAGLYVFTGCPFESTVGAHTEFAATFREIEALPVTAGVTYYIAIGTFALPQSTPYDLSIVINSDDCPDLDGDIGDPCDDGDPLTVDDVITEDCECVGTPVIDGQICELPIEVTSLPYLATDNTINYFDDYETTDLPALAPDAISNGYSTFYFGGDEVVYAYTPEEDGAIDVNLNNHSNWVGLFVITGCPFESTVGSHTASDNLGREIENLPVTAGTTYYIVISTWPFPQNTPYDLIINFAGFDCPDLEADFGDPCDDGDDDTINDQITGDCECAGTPTPSTLCGDYSSDPDIDFGGEFGTPSTISDDIVVSGTNGTILDLDVVLVIDHDWAGDVEARLTSPAGTTVDLVLGLCGSGDDINIALDDDAGALTCGDFGSIPILFGTFAPEGLLADFNGEDFDGTWTLDLEDTFPAADDGTLVSWCLVPDLEVAGNPECDNAQMVMAMPEFAESQIDVSMSGQVPSGVAQCINAENPQADMWFSFESITTNMYVRAWGLNDFDAAVEVYDSCGGMLLNCQNDEPAGEREVVIVTNTTVGETYYFRVYHAGDAAPVEEDYTVAVAHIPFTQLSESSCGVFDYTPADMITSDLPQNQFLLTNWYFEFTELEAPFNTYEILSPNGANPNFMLEWFPQAEYGRTYSVRTRARMYQGPQWGDYGDACEIGFSSEPLTTQLIEEQALGFYNMCDVLEADNVPGATGYRWKFFDGFNVINYDSPTRFCQLDLVEGLSLGSPYAVRIRAFTQGVLAPVGETRLIAMNNFVPDTQLDENITDCGATYPLNTVISAVNICAAEFYTFRFTNISDANQADLFYTRDDGIRSINLSWVEGLNAGDTYSVSVLGGSGGLVGEYGSGCEITIEGGENGIVEMPNSNDDELLSDVVIDLYPNPSTGEEVMVNLSNLGNVQQEVILEVYDIFGKKVHSEVLGNNGSQMIAVLKLNDLASGIYNVNIFVNEENVGSEKLVIQ